MDINHDQLANELEDKFKNRFTDKDDDYIRSLKLRDVSPPLIYPYWNHQNNFRRRGDNQHYDNRNYNQYNDQQRNYNQHNDQQRNYNQHYHNQQHNQQHRSNETYSNYRQDKKRKYDD